MLLIIYLLFLIPATYSYSDSIDLNCVDGNEYPEWAPDLPQDKIDLYGCAYTILGLKKKFSHVLTKDLTFYSSISTPEEPIQGALWALPANIQSGTSPPFISFSLFCE